MAVEFRTRRLVNPSRTKTARAKRQVRKYHSSLAKRFRKLSTKTSNPKKRRKLSPKQIAIFGTPAQKAALKRSKRTKNAGRRSFRKTKKRASKLFGSSHGYHRSKLATIPKPMRKFKARKKRRKNIGSIISVIPMANPGTRRKRRKVTNTVARRRRRNAGTRAGRSWSTYGRKRGKKNPGVRRRRRSVARRAAPVRRRRRSNPTFRVRRVRRVRRHARRNPGFLPSGNVVTKAIGFLAGAVGARYLTQLVLGNNNTGYIGYAGNVAAAVVLGMVTTKVTKSKELGNTVLVGGIAGTILRVIFDKTQYGSFIQQQLGMSGRGGDVGMGIISDSSFFSPQVAQPGSMTKFLTPAATRGYVAGQLAQTVSMAKAGSPGMGMTGRRARGSVI